MSGGEVKTFIAFRCRDGGYLLAPSGATSPWFENPSVEFLGEVRADSFCQVMTVAREMATRNFALISKSDFYFS